MPRVGEHVKIRFFKFLQLSVLHDVVLFFQAYHYCIKLLCFNLPSLHAITVHGVGRIVPHNPCPPLDHRVVYNVQQCNDATRHEILPETILSNGNFTWIIDNCWQILFYNRNYILSLWIQCLNTSKVQFTFCIKYSFPRASHKRETQSVQKLWITYILQNWSCLLLKHLILTSHPWIHDDRPRSKWETLVTLGEWTVVVLSFC